MSPSVLWMLVVSGVVAEAAELTKYLPENPAYPDVCYDPDEGVSQALGVGSVDGRCARFICRKCTADNKCYGHDHGYTLVTQTCGLMEPKPGCYRGGDDKKSYPECCMFPSCS